MSAISVPLDALAADGVLDENLSLDGLEEDLSNDNDSPLEPGEDMKAVDVSNAVKKKYGVPAQLTLGVKEAFALKCTKKKLTFESSSPKVAKVSAKGVVTALKKGAGGAVAEHIYLLVYHSILFNINVLAGYIGLRLVIIVV
jgi:hypothetical protein